MIIKSTRSLMLAASLMLIPTAFQTASAAGLSGLASSSLEKVSAATTSAQGAVTSTQSAVTSAQGAVATTQSAVTSVQGAATSAATIDSPSTLSINTATAEQLALIPGISATTAASIIKYRDMYGNFSSLTSLTSIDGIDASSLTKILPYLSL